MHTAYNKETFSYSRFPYQSRKLSDVHWHFQDRETVRYSILKHFCYEIPKKYDKNNHLLEEQQMKIISKRISRGKTFSRRSHFDEPKVFLLIRAVWRALKIIPPPTSFHPVLRSLVERALRLSCLVCVLETPKEVLWKESETYIYVSSNISPYTWFQEKHEKRELTLESHFIKGESPFLILIS